MLFSDLESGIIIMRPPKSASTWSACAICKDGHAVLSSHQKPTRVWSLVGR